MLKMTLELGFLESQHNYYIYLLVTIQFMIFLTKKSLWRPAFFPFEDLFRLLRDISMSLDNIGSYCPGPGSHYQHQCMDWCRACREPNLWHSLHDGSWRYICWNGRRGWNNRRWSRASWCWWLSSYSWTGAFNYPLLHLRRVPFSFDQVVLLWQFNLIMHT